MKPSSPHVDPAMEEQAALWAARLDGSVLSATDRIALDHWLAANPAHRALLSQFCQFSADLEQQMPLIAGIKEQSAETHRTPETAQPKPWLRRPLMAGAMLTAAAAVAVAFWAARPQQQFANIATPVAQRQTLTLADGTRVELNAQTNLQVEIDGRTRRVRLASGEAFFAVHKDPSRPFIVETPAGSVRVTGTKFDVRSEDVGAFEVTVVEGSVQARPGNAIPTPPAPLALTVGDRISFGPERVEHHTLSTAELDDALAWRRGQIIFNKTPLREAVARFARYHGRGITATADVAESSVGGQFSLDDLDGFFEALEVALPVKVTRNLNGTVQVARRSDQ
jgi:transmembrane sensor